MTKAKQTPIIGTATIIPTRKLVTVLVDGAPHPLAVGATDADVFGAIKPFVPFKEYMTEYAGPKDRCTVIVEPFLCDEDGRLDFDGTRARLKVKVDAFNEAQREPH